MFLLHEDVVLLSPLAFKNGFHRISNPTACSILIEARISFCDAVVSQTAVKVNVTSKLISCLGVGYTAMQTM